MFRIIRMTLHQARKVSPRLRSLVIYLLYGVRFRKFGKHSKLLGSDHITVGAGVALGDFCWIEAVNRYGSVRYTPNLRIGDRVAVSDLTHVSCVNKIDIGDDCLIGSKVYIGDHSHGTLSDSSELLNLAPAERPLGDIGEVVIGPKTWICDGVVILAGTAIARSSIVAANSVVRLREERPALIGGVPARVIRYLDGVE
jgi:acetyltransferase-like isoleucine patch superfamily enzyme